MAWVPIQYREFYDVPRAFIVKRGGVLFFFDSGFGDNSDEYAPQFRVYRLGTHVPEDLGTSSWHGLKSSGTFVGEVAVSSVRFDPTLRETVDDSVFDLL